MTDLFARAFLRLRCTWFVCSQGRRQAQRLLGPNSLSTSFPPCFLPLFRTRNTGRRRVAAVSVDGARLNAKYSSKTKRCKTKISTRPKLRFVVNRRSKKMVCCTNIRCLAPSAMQVGLPCAVSAVSAAFVTRPPRRCGCSG
jgi:hypothetical protein